MHRIGHRTAVPTTSQIHQPSPSSVWPLWTKDYIDAPNPIPSYPPAILLREMPQKSTSPVSTMRLPEVGWAVPCHSFPMGLDLLVFGLFCPYVRIPTARKSGFSTENDSQDKLHGAVDTSATPVLRKSHLRTFDDIPCVA